MLARPGAGAKAMKPREHVAAVQALVEQVKPFFAGKAPEIQGAALADLLAIWLTGCGVIGDPDQTRKLRADMLAMHLTTVRALVDLADHDA